MEQDVIAEMRPKLENFPGMQVQQQDPPTVRIGGQVTKSLYQFSMQSPEKKELYDASQNLLAEVQRLHGLQDVNSNLLIKSPQVNIKIDRDKAAAVGVNANQIENALYDAYGPRWVSTIYSPINEYKVLLELEPKYQSDEKALSLLYFKSGPGQLIPLNTLATVVQETGPQAINHFGQLPAVTISFDLAPGFSLGDAVARIQEEAKRVLPEAITTTFQGSAKAFQNSLGNLRVLLIVAIMVVYIVLAILFKSSIHPLTILSGLPSAGFGALLPP